MEGGWSVAEPTQERVWIHATVRTQRSTADVADKGVFWRVRRHTFHLCNVCQQLFDRDMIFMERIAQKASTNGGETA